MLAGESSLSWANQRMFAEGGSLRREVHVISTTHVLPVLPLPSKEWSSVTHPRKVYVTIQLNPNFLRLDRSAYLQDLDVAGGEPSPVSIALSLPPTSRQSLDHFDNLPGIEAQSLLVLLPAERVQTSVVGSRHRTARRTKGKSFYGYTEIKFTVLALLSFTLW